MNLNLMMDSEYKKKVRRRKSFQKLEKQWKVLHECKGCEEEGLLDLFELDNHEGVKYHWNGWLDKCSLESLNLFGEDYDLSGLVSYTENRST